MMGELQGQEAVEQPGRGPEKKSGSYRQLGERNLKAGFEISPNLWPRLLVTAALFVTSLALYFSTLAPSVVALFDDSLEFQLVTYRLAVAHPTGYPLYTLLGKLFTLLPFGDVAYRVNLMSAVFGAATVALLYLLVLQISPPKTKSQDSGGPAGPENMSPSWPTHLGGIIGAALLAVSLVFWQQATVAEVYTLNAFFILVLLVIATSLPPASAQARERQILGLAFCFGLSLTHHRTMLLLLPGLLLYLFFNYRSLILKRRVAIAGVLLGLLPLLLYLYLPLRGHVGSLDGSYQNNWAGFWRQISAGGYGLFLFGNPFGHERDFIFYWNLLADQFYTTVPGLIGLVYLLRLGQRKMVLLTGLAFLTYFAFNLFYKVTDIAVFFIPVFLIWAAWSGTGAAFLLRTWATLKSVPGRVGLVSGTLALFIFIIFQLFMANAETISQLYTWQVHDYGLDVLAQLPPAEEQESAVVGILGEMTLLRYFQQTENRRPDLITVAADLEADRLAAVENRLAQGQTVYLTRQLPGAAERWSLNAVGPLIRVDPEPVIHPPEMAVAMNQPVTPEITLLGYTVSRPPHTGPGPAPVRLTLFWQAAGPIPQALKVSARLLDPAGQPVTTADAVPVHFAYPTPAWRPGEVISDVYDLNLPADIPSEQYTPLVIWYNPAQNGAELGRIELEPVRL